MAQDYLVSEHRHQVDKAVGLLVRILKHQGNTVDCKDADLLEATSEEVVDELDSVIHQWQRTIEHQFDAQLKIDRQLVELALHLVTDVGVVDGFLLE